MKKIRVIAATALLASGLALAVPGLAPIPQPAQPIEKALELARQEIGRTDAHAAEYLLMVASYDQPSHFARRLTEPEENKAVMLLGPGEYVWFIELRHPVNTDHSYTLVVKRDGTVEILGHTV